MPTSGLMNPMLGVPGNTSGLRIMSCKFEELVTGLFPTEMSRLASSLLGFRLPKHGEVLILSSHLICQSKKTDVFWEEAERCGWVCSAPGFLSHYRFLQNKASQQPLLFDIGYGLLPARKRAKNVTLKTIREQCSYSSNLEFFGCRHVIYTKQIRVEFIWLNADSYICRSYQKAVVYISN